MKVLFPSIDAIELRFSCLVTRRIWSSPTTQLPHNRVPTFFWGPKQSLDAQMTVFLA